MTIRSLLNALVLVALLSVGACAPAVENGDGGPRASQDVITTEEIRASSDSNAHQLIERLRPNWFRMRASVDAPVVVYVDGSRRGGREQLQSISTSTMARAQFLSGSAATTRFGLDHGSGAILITTTGR
ncbi:hypothetical protein BH23GEM6_BH23GEM6_24590 [soil metagenome]